MTIKTEVPQKEKMTERQKRLVMISGITMTPTLTEINKMSAEEIHNHIHELQAQKIELELQNEELLRRNHEGLLDVSTEETLPESAKGYHTAYSLMRRLCDNVPDMIWAKDTDNKYIFANKAICHGLLNAVSTDEPIGKTDMFFDTREKALHPEDPNWHTFGDTCLESDALTMATGEPQRFMESGYVQGKLLFVEVCKAPFLDIDGNLIGTVGSARDMTHAKEVEQALQKTANHLQTLVQTIPDLICLKDPNGIFLDCNPMIERLYGASRKEIIGKTDYDFFDKEQADYFCSNDRKAMETRGPVTSETWLTFSDNGHRALFQVIKTPMYDTDGKILGVLGIARDITALKQTEEALKASLAEKDVLLREVHHRVKNNMAAIIGLFNVQRQAMNDPQIQQVLTDLSSRVRAMSLVHEKLYRSDSLASIDFQDYIQSLISHLRTSFGSPAIKCHIDAKGVRVPLDLAVPCGMIINELVTNSLKFAFTKGQTSSTGSCDRLQVTMSHDAGTFQLSIADNGVGLPPDFDLQTVNTLGLVLVRMLGQHQLGGVYQIDHAGGTRFTLTFSIRNREKLL